MIRLILARHGNTFAPGDKVFWVGRSQNLPLVDAGKEQAVKLGEALRNSKVIPTEIRSGPLVRATEFSELIRSKTGQSASIIVDERLDEIDYGMWGGLTNEEVLQRYGTGVIEAWTNHGIWPNQCHWQPTKETLEGEVRELLDEYVNKEGTHLFVSSNGRLRFFRHIVEGNWEGGSMKTGNCALLVSDQGKWRIEFWDKEQFRLPPFS